MKKGAVAKRNAEVATTTGHYSLGKYQELLKKVVADNVSVVITLPYSWAVDNIRVLSPDILRLVELKVAPDRQFPEPSTFVLERGSKKYKWSGN